jgi:hypothetical protein
MAIFECIHTSGRYEFLEPETINNMRKHSEYQEIVAVPAPVLPAASVDKPLPKPKKVKE